VRRDGGLDYVVVDGKQRAAYRGIAGWSVAIAHDHIAFAARNDKWWFVVRDGHTDRERWSGIGELRLAENGKVVYSAERAGGWHVVQDGVVGPRHDAILANTLRIAGGHVAYVAQERNRSRVVVDGKLQDAFDGIGQLVLRGRPRLVYRAARSRHARRDRRCRGAGTRARLDDRPGPPGRRVYAATFGDATRLVNDGELGPTVDSIRHIEFVGERVAWLGRLGKLDVLALDDTPSPHGRRVASRSSRFGWHDITRVRRERG
jgi:hypothetical protein